MMISGPADSIRVSSFDSGDLSVVNGKSMELDVEVVDKGGNVTTQPRLNVLCKVWIGIEF